MNDWSSVIQIWIYTKRTNPLSDSRKSYKDQNKDLNKLTIQIYQNNLANLKYITK
jgi:hypothetical protein